MNTNDQLNKCLAILRSIAEDQTSLEKLLEFMEDEFVSKIQIVDPLIDYKLQIDEKYRPIVKEIAEYLEMGHVVFVNPETLEIESIPEDYDPLVTDFEFDYDDMENWISIEPPESCESYKVMEAFVERLPKSKMRDELVDAIDGYKPFANFNRLIHNSKECEEWFRYKTCQLEKYVINNYLTGIIN